MIKHSKHLSEEVFVSRQPQDAVEICNDGGVLC